MLVIITRSDDASVNLLSGYLKNPFLRINVDEDDSWSFMYDDGRWYLKNSGDLHLITSETRCWFWKAYLDAADGDSYRNAEVQYLVREIYAEVGRRGQIVGNSPFFHHNFGKLSILDVARQHFEAPRTNAVFNQALQIPEDIVVKSLASAQFSNSKVLFTTRTEAGRLQTNGNPWLAQEYVDSVSDVTTYIVGARHFTFERARTPGVTVDWRKEQLEDLSREAWAPLELAPNEQNALVSFARELGIHWGRIDFVRQADGRLWFLEFNANGQFGFLDEFNRTGIFDAIALYLEGLMHPKD